MTPEQLKELEEKAKLWDSLGPLLKTIHGSKFERPTVTTIENISNSSTFIDVLKEENEEMIKVDKIRNFYHSTNIFGFFNIIKENKICTHYGKEIGSYFSDKYAISSLFGDYTFCISAKYSDFETDATNDGFFYRGEYLLNTEKFKKIIIKRSLRTAYGFDDMVEFEEEFERIFACVTCDFNWGVKQLTITFYR